MIATCMSWQLRHGNGRTYAKPCNGAETYQWTPERVRCVCVSCQVVGRRGAHENSAKREQLLSKPLTHTPAASFWARLDFLRKDYTASLISGASQASRTDVVKAGPRPICELRSIPCVHKFESSDTQVVHKHKLSTPKTPLSTYSVS